MKHLNLFALALAALIAVFSQSAAYAADTVIADTDGNVAVVDKHGNAVVQDADGNTAVIDKHGNAVVEDADGNVVAVDKHGNAEVLTDDSEDDEEEE